LKSSYRQPSAISGLKSSVAPACSQRRRLAKTSCGEENAALFASAAAKKEIRRLSGGSWHLLRRRSKRNGAMKTERNDIEESKAEIFIYCRGGRHEASAWRNNGYEASEMCILLAAS
jgi:hypothetical protein